MTTDSNATREPVHAVKAEMAPFIESMCDVTRCATLRVRQYSSPVLTTYEGHQFSHTDSLVTCDACREAAQP